MTVVAGSLTIPAEATPRTSGEEFFRTEGAYTGLDQPIPGGQIARWLLVEGPHIDSGVKLFDELFPTDVGCVFAAMAAIATAFLALPGRQPIRTAAMEVAS